LAHKQYNGDAEIVVAGGMENMSMIHITSTLEMEPNLVQPQ
jgi:acetyl-CoA acetyltransferase